MRVCIIGAGLAGLTAGHLLSEKGYEVVIFEKERYVGGLAATLKFGKFFYDLGPHRYHSKDEKLINYFKTVLNNKFLIKDRLSHIFLNNKFFKYPITPKSIFKLSKKTMAKAVVDLMKVKIANKKESNNFEDYTVNLLGKTLYDTFFGGYTQKVLGIKTKEISLDWASRIDGLSVKSILKNLIKNKNKPRTFASKFYYPSECGIGELSNALAKKIKQNHGKIITSNGVTGFEKKKGKITAVISNGKKTKVDVVINTMPITELYKMLTTKNSNLFFRDMVFVMIELNRKELTKNHWIYFPETDYLFNRISEPKNFNEKMCPNGKSSVIIEITCFRNDDIWNTSDEDIFKKAKLDLEKSGLVKSDEIVNYKVMHITNAYPVYKLGYEKELEKVKNELSKFKNLITTGREGAFKYNNMDYSIEMGMNAAEDIIKLNSLKIKS